jgi:hypothetical protein
MSGLPLFQGIKLNIVSWIRPKLPKNKHYYVINYESNHHHQPINVPTAGVQAFLMDYE